jgi:Ser/Thr protein kinase RdoA (MazF antagonist)
MPLLTFPAATATLGSPHKQIIDPRATAQVAVASDGIAPDVIAPGIIVHNDFAPYNHVFSDGGFVGAIDFDTCYPASREWDLAWTLYRYVYLPGFASLAPAKDEYWSILPPSQARRIAEDCTSAAATFMAAYG